MTADPITASVHVDAAPERVFQHFTDSVAITRWMGQWADLAPMVGGRFAVDVEGVAVRGRYLELDPPRRLVVSWGHAESEHLPPGASTVEILLSPEAGGTRVEIRHSDLPEPEASRHPAGWRRFLAQLARVAPSTEGRAAAPEPAGDTAGTHREGDRDAWQGRRTRGE